MYSLRVSSGQDSPTTSRGSGGARTRARSPRRLLPESCRRRCARSARRRGPAARRRRWRGRSAPRRGGPCRRPSPSRRRRRRGRRRAKERCASGPRTCVTNATLAPDVDTPQLEQGRRNARRLVQRRAARAGIIGVGVDARAPGGLRVLERAVHALLPDLRGGVVKISRGRRRRRAQTDELLEGLLEVLEEEGLVFRIFLSVDSKRRVLLERQVGRQHC